MRKYISRNHFDLVLYDLLVSLFDSEKVHSKVTSKIRFPSLTSL